MTENRTLHALVAAAVAALLGAAAMIFLYAPQDALQGPVQRILGESDQVNDGRGHRRDLLFG